MEYGAAYSYDDFDTWRAKRHPEHFNVPTFPTLSDTPSPDTSEEKLEPCGMLGHNNPITTSETPERAQALLGESKR